MVSKIIKLIILLFSVCFLGGFILRLFFINLKFIETTDADPYLPGPVGYVWFGIFCLAIIVSILIYMLIFRVSFSSNGFIICSFIPTIIVVITSYVCTMVLINVHPYARYTIGLSHNPPPKAKYTYCISRFVSNLYDYLHKTNDYSFKGVIRKTDEKIATEIYHDNYTNEKIFSINIIDAFTNTIIIKENNNEIIYEDYKSQTQNINELIHMNDHIPLILKSNKFEGKITRFNSNVDYKFFFIINSRFNYNNIKDKVYIVITSGEPPVYDNKLKIISNALRTIKLDKSYDDKYLEALLTVLFPDLSVKSGK